MAYILMPAIAWVPIRKPLLHGFDEYETARSGLLRDLGKAIQCLGKEVKDVSVSIATPPISIFTTLSAKAMGLPADVFDFFCIRVSIEIDMGELQRRNEGQVLEPKFVNASGPIVLSTLIEQVLVLSELAYPGCITSTEGMAISNDGTWCSVHSKGAFHDLLDTEDEDFKWPQLKTYGLPRVVGWASKTSFAEGALGLAKVERCLAAYTQAIGLTHLRMGEVLFRAMQALEAFYCDGSGDLRKQLSDKSAIWLGRWPDGRNIVGHLYDLRSKFVHGAAPLEYWPQQRDSWDENEKLMASFHSGAEFAMRLLIATLQRCIELDVRELSWSYSVSVE